MAFDYIDDFLLPAGCQHRLNGPTTPRTQRLTAITRPWFSLFRFRSPLLTESLLFSLPVGTEMFHFPTFPPRTLCVQMRVTGHDSCRVSPFGHPRITARLAAPRGLSQPPTSFIGSWCQGIHRAPLVTWPQRCSRPLCSSQATGKTSRHRCAPHNRGRPPTTSLPCPWTSHPRPIHQQDTEEPRTNACSLRPQQRAQSLRDTHLTNPTAQHDETSTTDTRTNPSQRSTHEPPPGDTHPWQTTSTEPPTRHPASTRRQLLLRKEVIQPHLPVRLPCYDFVPIAGPTFDSSLPQGVRPPASGVTDFRDVTGGVYKARERIHRSVADLRLLATPTSWGRVADPNPN